GLVLHFLDVGAGGEGFFGAGNDHGADRFVRIEGLGRGQQFGKDLGVQGVEGIGPVERNEPDLAAFFGDDCFIAHVVLRGRYATGCITSGRPDNRRWSGRTVRFAGSGRRSRALRIVRPRGRRPRRNAGNSRANRRRGYSPAATSRLPGWRRLSRCESLRRGG